MKEQSLAFLRKESFCIVATVNSDCNPEAAFVAFSENEDLEIMIGTSKESRKYQNILQNPHVALEFGLDGMQTLQYEGIARILDDEERSQRSEAHFIKQPGSKKYDSDPSQVYIVIKPTWIRISTSGPKVLGELRFSL